MANDEGEILWVFDERLAELLAAIRGWIPPANQNSCRNEITMARRERIIKAFQIYTAGEES
jgi:ArsR family metal-binding transcriptional regulator